MAHQIRAIAKERLEEKGGEILAEDFREQIRKAIRIYLEL
ncbi:MAG TPA: hypothetical protein DHV84_03165 [Desulfotomaculum sp.]|jgi:mRNA-degrading endonuclease toxin of MazEF toxin-antitoxin module|nr:hypothetical protein [Desulfotomaculum sp.]